MEIKIHAFYDVMCSECGQWRSTDYNKGMGYSRDSVRKNAKAEGWKVVDGETLCPRCAMERKNKRTD